MEVRQVDSMDKIADKLNKSLESDHRVVYVSDDFAWKELALEKIKTMDNTEIVLDLEALELYRMYEFSDRFIVLEENDKFGSIWNYVRNGMISAEEALECLFGECNESGSV